VLRACPACNTDVAANQNFCHNCGANLTVPPPAGESAPVTAETTSPTATTTTAPSPPKAAVIPEGERRHATIMLSDLSGYTAMNEMLDPETVQEIMRRVQGIAETIVADHGGIINQTVGDEIVALFGFPTAHENDQGAAVQAALALHAAVRELSDDVPLRTGRRLAMHTGIATGLSVFSRSDERGGLYSVTGDTINTAARLSTTPVRSQAPSPAAPSRWRSSVRHSAARRTEPARSSRFWDRRAAGRAVSSGNSSAPFPRTFKS